MSFVIEGLEARQGVVGETVLKPADKATKKPCKGLVRLVRLSLRTRRYVLRS